ncbi:MAG: peptidase C26 [Planctomycetota bacterium]|nr:MAG: peptidase C26 [Planctomycetota bacterium]
MQPFIGVTCSAEENGDPVVRPAYVQAVHRAGGVAVALPFLESREQTAELLSRLDGLLLTGSEDLDSALWSEPLHPEALPMHPRRQTTEMLLCRELLLGELPVLAICGGMQNLAVAAGGRIHQHIPDLGEHVRDHGAGTHAEAERHPVRCEAGSVLAEFLGAECSTNSAHHQAVASLGAGQQAVAFCDDGLIEAFEMPERPFTLAVQWHPEQLPEERGQAALFDALIRAAGG